MESYRMYSLLSGLGLSIMFLSFIQVAVRSRGSFLFTAERYSMVEMYHVCPLTGGWAVGCFQF